MSQYHGTIKHNPTFNLEQATEGLRKAMKGLGTDEKAIIQILTSCNAAQRSGCIKQYKTMYGKDLLDDLKSELGGNLETVVLALMKTTAEFDAWTLRQAMKGAGTDEPLLLEILGSRTNVEINNIKLAYSAHYKRDLEADVVSETGGRFRRLLVGLLQASRSEAPVDRAKAAASAHALKAAGEDKFGTDESEFQKVLMTSSSAQLKVICEEYRKISDYDLEKVIKKELSGDLERGFVTLIRSSREPEVYFAELIHEAMAGAGTNDEQLIRLIVSRCEIDMVEIKQAYALKFGKTLAHDIKGDCAGDYKKILLALVGDD